MLRCFVTGTAVQEAQPPGPAVRNQNPASRQGQGGSLTDTLTMFLACTDDLCRGSVVGSHRLATL